MTEEIGEIEMEQLPDKICEGLPSVFSTYISYCRSLNSDEQPNYDHLRQLFVNLFRACGFRNEDGFCRPT